mmetsp:Transcript_24703/g.65281  ORF Transcript_24703/g.65281 Transcript_24703/m.65281 type:complete len:237 (+) Transcript_24703:294-1004(+)
MTLSFPISSCSSGTVLLSSSNCDSGLRSKPVEPAPDSCFGSGSGGVGWLFGGGESVPAGPTGKRPEGLLLGCGGPPFMQVTVRISASRLASVPTRVQQKSHDMVCSHRGASVSGIVGVSCGCSGMSASWWAGEKGKAVTMQNGSETPPFQSMFSRLSAFRTVTSSLPASSATGSFDVASASSLVFGVQLYSKHSLPRTLRRALSRFITRGASMRCFTTGMLGSSLILASTSPMNSD